MAFSMLSNARDIGSSGLHHEGRRSHREMAQGVVTSPTMISDISGGPSWPASATRRRITECLNLYARLCVANCLWQTAYLHHIKLLPLKSPVAISNGRFLFQPSNYHSLDILLLTNRR